MRGFRTRFALRVAEIVAFWLIWGFFATNSGEIEPSRQLVLIGFWLLLGVRSLYLLIGFLGYMSFERRKREHG